MDATLPSISSGSFHDSLGLSSQADPVAVAESLESVFASMLIKEMRNTLPNGFFSGENSDVMGGMFDMHLGNAITEQEGLGIKQLVLSQLGKESVSAATPDSVRETR